MEVLEAVDLAGRRPRYRVAIVDDHELVATMLTVGMAAHGYEATAIAPTSFTAVLAELRRWRPDVVLLDLKLDGLDGLTLVEPITMSRVPVIILTGLPDERSIAVAVALGAVGHVAKGASFQDLVSAVTRVTGGQQLLTSEFRDELKRIGAQQLARRGDLQKRVRLLTAREREVLALLSGGETAPEIAVSLMVSVSTVRTYVRGILLKLGVSSQLAAVAAVAENLGGSSHLL